METEFLGKTYSESPSGLPYAVKNYVTEITVVGEDRVVHALVLAAAAKAYAEWKAQQHLGHIEFSRHPQAGCQEPTPTCCK